MNFLKSFFKKKLRDGPPKKGTVSGNPPEVDSGPAPTNEKLSDGQYADHWVLSNDERNKGFVRPVRKSYIHVGAPYPKHPLRDLTEKEKARFPDEGYVKFEIYPEDHHALGRFWTHKQLHGCGQVTTMSRSIAETYARDPGFYGGTFCASCGDYFPVGKDGEFVWQDNQGYRVGT